MKKLLYTTILAGSLATTNAWAQETTTPDAEGSDQTETMEQTETEDGSGEAAPEAKSSDSMEDSGTDGETMDGAGDDGAASDDGAAMDDAETDGAATDDGAAMDDAETDGATTDDGAMDGADSEDAATEEAAPADSAEQTDEQMNQSEATGSGSGEAVVSQQDTSEMLGDWLLNTTVTSPDGENIGNIQDFIISEDGQVKAVLLSVGGFLGIGSKDIAVDYSQLDIQYDGDEIVLDMTREQADAAQEYQYRDKQNPPAPTGDTGMGTGTGTDGGMGTTGGTTGTGSGTGTAQ